MQSIDLHEIRSSLKLIRDTGDSAHYENRGSAPCPVCREVFDEVLETTERTRTLSPSAGISICLVNEDGRVLLFTHA